MYPIAPSRTYFAFACILFPRFVGCMIGSSGPESSKEKKERDVRENILSYLEATSRRYSPSRSLRKALFMPVIVSAINAACAAMVNGLQRGCRVRHVGGRVGG